MPSFLNSSDGFRLVDFLDCVQVVMVETTLPANIGSAARAMHTAGLRHLTVVNPKLPIDASSYANSAAASQLLDKANIVHTLDEAIFDCHLILAASARSRHLPRPVLTPTLAAKLIGDFIFAQLKTHTKPKITLLFGREDRGLTNEELAKAHYHIQIPANPDYPVLNVASSVQVIVSILYEHFLTSFANDKVQDAFNQQSAKNHIDITFRQAWDEPAINAQQASQLQQDVIDLLTQLDLANKDDLRALPNRLSRLCARLQLDCKEYALIRATLAKLAASLKQ